MAVWLDRCHEWNYLKRSFVFEVCFLNLFKYCTATENPQNVHFAPLNEICKNYSKLSCQTAAVLSNVYNSIKVKTILFLLFLGLKNGL